LKKKISIFLNDAGSAEYVAHLIFNNKDIYKWKVFVLSKSPAESIFHKLDINMQSFNDIDNLINSFHLEEPDIVMYGTGRQVQVPYLIESLYKDTPIVTIGLIDHWTNYLKRFVYERNLSIPNYVVVMDEFSYKKAVNIFQYFDTKVVEIVNYYFKDLVEEFEQKVKYNHDSLVFISEPTTMIAEYNFNNKSYYGFTEYSALKDILNNFSWFQNQFKVSKVTIRLHPSDKLDKYDYLKRKFGKINIEIISPLSEPLIETLSKSLLTVGFDGMALFISYLLGLKTISYMPGNREMTIPMSKQFFFNTMDKEKIVKCFSSDGNLKHILGKTGESFDSLIKKINYV
jgi:hypothetical protein